MLLKRFTCSWWQNMLIWQRTTCTVERNLEYVYDIDQLYNQSRLDPDETILQVVLKGSFLTSELTNLARHYLEISAVLKDDKGTVMLSLNQRFFRWINWNGRCPNENVLLSVAYLGTFSSYKMIDAPDFGYSLRLFYVEILTACKSDSAKLPKINFSVALLTENSQSCRLDLGRFLAYLNGREHKLGVKAITDVKKSAKATADVKPLIRSVDWPNFRTVKIVKLVANFQWAELPKSWFSVALPGQIYRL